MRNGKCSKCGSTTVYAQSKGVGGVNGVELTIGIFARAVNVTSFVCTTCGYFENYIADTKKLAEVAQKWPKVPEGGV